VSDSPAAPTPGDQTEQLRVESPDLDTESIMQEIRARLRARREQAKAQGLDFEAYADGLYPIDPDAVMSRDLHEAVRQAGLGYDKVNVEMMLTETRLPLLGGFVHRVRSALHGLVLFYVNRLAGRQIHFNEQTARALVAMVRDLEAEVRDLRARVSSLEASDE
jgi:hypothetical protein